MTRVCVEKGSLLICCLDLRVAEGVGSGVLEGGVVGVPGGRGSGWEQGDTAEMPLSQEELSRHHQVPADRGKLRRNYHRLKT